MNAPGNPEDAPELTMGAILASHQRETGIRHRDLSQHCICGWIGSRDEPLYQHQAEQLEAEGFGKTK
jgi:hypothetical protein